MSRSQVYGYRGLAAGLLAYTLVGAWLVAGAQRSRASSWGLSFQRVLHRVLAMSVLVAHGWPHSRQQREALGYQVERCPVAHQPGKVRHEPRRVRRRPKGYRALIGERNMARQEVVHRWLPT